MDIIVPHAHRQAAVSEPHTKPNMCDPVTISVRPSVVPRTHASPFYLECIYMSVVVLVDLMELGWHMGHFTCLPIGW